MRIFPFVAVPVAIVLAIGCHRTAEEQTTHYDAGPALNPLFFGPTVSSASAGDGAAPIAPGGRADVHTFCSDVFIADSVRMEKKCVARDLNISKALAKAASKLCDDDVNAAVVRSRTSFDPDAAKACIQMLEDKDLPKSSENDTFFAHFPCDGVMLGTEDDGQPCRFSVECKNGLACVGYAPGTDGACKKPPKAGEACTLQRFGSILNEDAAKIHHPECAAGAWCDGTKCQPVIAAGQACVASASCTGGLSCVTAKCGKPAVAGGTCFQPSDCAFGLWCTKGGGAASGHCEPKLPDGATCTELDACKGRCDMPKPPDGGSPPPGVCRATCGSG